MIERIGHALSIVEQAKWWYTGLQCPYCLTMWGEWRLLGSDPAACTCPLCKRAGAEFCDPGTPTVMVKQ